MKKQASSQAAWALLTEGVARSRVTTHTIHQLLNRAIQLIEGSEQKDHLYQVAGDLIQGLPKCVERLERQLDQTSYALSKMGEDFLGSHLPLSDKNHVDDAVLTLPSEVFLKSRMIVSEDLLNRVVSRYNKKARG